MVILLFGLTGEWLIELLYDPRYHAAGPMLVLLAVSIVPAVVLDGCKHVLLANGNSRNFTILIVCLGIIRTALLLWLISSYGIVGAIIAPFVSNIVIYPLMAHFARQYRGWLPAVDLAFSVLGGVIIAVVLWASPAARDLLTAPFL